VTWFTRQFATTLALLLGTIAFFELTDADLLVQDLLFNFDTGLWLLDKEEPISRLLFYSGIRNVYGLAALCLIGTLVFFRKIPRIRENWHGLLIVCLSLILVPLIINLIKAVSNVPCPGDLELYEGDYPHVTLFTAYPEGFVQEYNIRCYPAGHASGGFALLSLFFLFRTPRARRRAVITAMVVAWTAGLYKMIIGDHFLSHTLVTMFLAWLLILSIARVVDPRAVAQLGRIEPAEPSATTHRHDSVWSGAAIDPKDML
jgi:membrane-associated PAP2 superfamily phosphatase